MGRLEIIWRQYLWVPMLEKTKAKKRYVEQRKHLISRLRPGLLRCLSSWTHLEATCFWALRLLLVKSTSQGCWVLCALGKGILRTVADKDSMQKCFLLCQAPCEGLRIRKVSATQTFPLKTHDKGFWQGSKQQQYRVLTALAQDRARCCDSAHSVWWVRKGFLMTSWSKRSQGEKEKLFLTKGKHLQMLRQEAANYGLWAKIHPPCSPLVSFLLRWHSHNLKLPILKDSIQWNLEHSQCCTSITSV